MNVQKVSGLDFDKAGGLIPVIAQCAMTGGVLFQRWMDEKAFRQASEKRPAAGAKPSYLQRDGSAMQWSGGLFWEQPQYVNSTSQYVDEIFMDCDGDTLLLRFGMSSGHGPGVQMWSSHFLRTKEVDFGASPDALLPVTVQDADNNDVLMLAYMNLEAFEQTRSTGTACYWSRSRQELWRKGEKSGHMQKVRGIFYDPDGPSLLLKVEQVGGACHNGYRSCFYRCIEGDQLYVIAERAFDPSKTHGQ